MAYSELLYYPTYDPPVDWLKANLLFARKVRTIVPQDVSPQYHPANRALFEAAPDLFEECRFLPNSVSLDANMAVLDEVFGRIAAERHGGELDITIERDGTLGIDNHVFLHHSKASQELIELLQRHRLYVPEMGEAMSGQAYYLVTRRAAGIIMGLVADKLARRNGWVTGTDQDLEYYTVAMNDVVSAQGSDASVMLASTIISAEIPIRLAAFTAEQFLELRKRYERLRELFQLAVDELCTFERLDAIGDSNVLLERVQNTAEQFSVEIAKLRTDGHLAWIKEWMPFSIGTLGRIGAWLSTTPVLQGIGRGVSVLVSIYDKVRPAPSTSRRADAQRLLIKLQDDILRNEVFKTIPLRTRRVKLQAAQNSVNPPG